MRFLHTADWHLGRALHGVSLVEDQAHALDLILEAARELKPDVLLMAGDVYDRAVPPADAVNLFDDFLNRAALQLQLPVILIAGNHDSADRLAFGGTLLAKSGVHVVARPARECVPIELRDAHGPVYVCPIPFVEPALVRERLGDADVRTHGEAIAAYARRFLEAVPREARAICMAHGYVSGGIESESERPLFIGGVEGVAPETFAGFRYTALGHLHAPQSVAGGIVRYSGSPLKYSISEVLHKKGFNLIEMDGAGNCKMEFVPLVPLRDLRIVEGTLPEILEQGARDASHNDYIVARIGGRDLHFDAMARLRSVYPNALRIERPDFVAAVAPENSARTADRSRGMLELFADFARDVSGNALTDEQALVLADVLKSMDAEAES